MKIKTSVGKTSTSFSWDFNGKKIKYKLGGRANAEYSESNDLIVVAATDETVRILSSDSSLIIEFPCNESDKRRFYLLEKSSACELGVRIIMAHTPEYKGERFWQHDIDIENKSISEPKAKWR
ncbi:hypothetical protein SAMN02745866_00906 [Alteromonadaceae bacterium Bs31]|nr:hypothetical protein SAMN02745866_00906 [Alteromonadaceae bacterium Bs31]